MNLFSKLFRTTGRPISSRPAMVSTAVASDLPTDGTGASTTHPLSGSSAPDFDSNECAHAQAAATFVQLNECY